MTRAVALMVLSITGAALAHGLLGVVRAITSDLMVPPGGLLGVWASWLGASLLLVGSVFTIIAVLPGTVEGEARHRRYTLALAMAGVGLLILAASLPLSPWYVLGIWEWLAGVPAPGPLVHASVALLFGAGLVLARRR